MHRRGGGLRRHLRARQFDRPVVGLLNFCPAAAAVLAGEDFERALAVCKLEAVHALGFSDTSWALMRHADEAASPRTAREDETNLPAREVRTRASTA